MPPTRALRIVLICAPFLGLSGCIALGGLGTGATPSLVSVYASAVMADQPIAYWRLQETSSDLGAKDEVSRMATGFFGPDTIFGIQGPFYDTSNLDAGSSAIGAADSGPAFSAPLTLVAGTGFSLEAMLFIPSNLKSGDFPLIVQLGNSSVFSWASLTYEPTNAALKFTHYDSTGAPSSVSANIADDQDQWIHIVATTDAIQGGNLNLFVDGDAMAQQSITSTATFNSLSGIEAVSGLHSGHGPVDIAELAIYASVLSPTQATAHYDAIDSD